MTSYHGEKTKVIFRKFIDGGDIIAIFPEIPGTRDPQTCLSYQHADQHGPASLDILRGRVTVEASAAEYRPLKRELERRGYRLRIVDRRTSRDDERRRVALSLPARPDGTCENCGAPAEYDSDYCLCSACEKLARA